MTNKPLPHHSKTPTGHWGFFKQLELEDSRGTFTSTHCAPEGISVMKLEDARERFMTLITDHNSIMDFHKRNCKDGFVIVVDKTADEPVMITHEIDGGSAQTHTIVIVRPNAQATVFEQFSGSCDHVTHVVEVFLEENGTLTYANTQNIDGTYLSEKKADTRRNASMTWFELNANTKSYSRVTSDLKGEGAETKNHSIYLGQEGSFTDYRGIAEHEAPRTASNLLTKGVLFNDAQAIYEGELQIGQKAPKSNAFQEEDCLLLSPDADIKASPRLFINNNDVRCSHAATVTRPDKEKMFYLMSRGIDVQDSQKLLITAHIWSVIEDLDGPAQRIISDPVTAIVQRVVNAWT